MTPAVDAPFVGLEPFSRTHEDYFFGRTLDASNALTRPITVLFAASGVGKSSLLLAGLPRSLEATYRCERVEPLVQEDWEIPEYRHGAAINLVVQRNWRSLELASEWLMDTVTSAPQDSPLLLVFDQFEDYFLYRDRRVGEAFEERLAAVLSDSSRLTHAVLSLREDALHHLDHVRLSLPSVLDNTLALDHLDETAVREAIAGPIEVFNRNNPGTSISIGTRLANDFISQMRTATKAVGRRHAEEDFWVELPFLQLALKKLWDRMRQDGGSSFGSHLLSRMEGLEGVVRDHLKDKLDSLSDVEQFWLFSCSITW